MAFCNWCSLETESDETCEWCRRPIRRNLGVYSSFGSSVAMLREDDDLPADRVTAVFGVAIGLAFVGLLLFAGMSYRGGNKLSDPLSQIAESEKTWTAERTAPALSPPSVPVVAASATPPPAPHSAARSPRPTSPAASGSSGRVGHAVSTSAMQLDGAFEVASSSGSTGFHVEAAKLSVSREPGGTFAVRGEVKLSNLSGGRVSEIKLQIVSAAGTVPLDIGDQDRVIGSGASRTFRVAASGVSSEIVNDPAAYVEVEGVSAEGPYKDRIALR